MTGNIEPFLREKNLFANDWRRAARIPPSVIDDWIAHVRDVPEFVIVDSVLSTSEVA